MNRECPKATTYFADKLADGTLTYFEPYLFLSGDAEEFNGFFIMRGPETRVLAMINEPRRLELEARATQILAHVTTEVLLTGEAVIEQINRFVKVNEVLVPA